MKTKESISLEMNKNKNLSEIWKNAVKHDKTREFHIMLVEFKKQIQSSIDQMHLPLNPIHPSAIILHKLKSAAKQLGLQQLGKFAEILEDKIRTDSDINVKTRDLYKSICKDAIQELDRWIKYTTNYLAGDK